MIKSNQCQSVTTKLAWVRGDGLTDGALSLSRGEPRIVTLVCNSPRRPSFMTEIIIKGLRVASKKNNRRNFGHISLPSLAYEKFKDLSAEFLMPHKGDITRAFRMNIIYTIKGNYHQDLDNALNSVLDVLTDYGVIPDDDLCMQVNATKFLLGKDWSIAIELEEI